MTAIVIPVADIAPQSTQLLEALLFSIEQGGYLPDYSVIVCFDACRDAFVQKFCEKPWVIPVINRGNHKNFAGNCNDGLRKAFEMGMDAVAVNQDCVLPERKYFDRIHGEGIVVPTPVQICKEVPIDDSDLEKLNSSQTDQLQKTPHDKLIGFCMYLSRPLMEKVGFFDESFKATFEDDDICARALLAGLPVEHVNVNVNHYVSRCGSYDNNRLQINLFKFRAKWSIPDEISHGEFNKWIKNNHKWHPDMKEV